MPRFQAKLRPVKIVKIDELFLKKSGEFRITACFFSFQCYNKLRDTSHALFWAFVNSLGFSADFKPLALCRAISPQAVRVDGVSRLQMWEGLAPSRGLEFG